MTKPTATYRLQFRNGMTFDRAIELIPYWQALGISHLYASPIFAATEGSTHGYDVTDPNVIDPAIGGHEGFERLSLALRQADLGLILDIVPNHLAASLENPWWRSVIELGAESPYACHFDIDWDQKLTIPILPDSLEEVIDRGELKVVCDSDTCNWFFDYWGNLYPLHPRTYIAAAENRPLGEIHDLQPFRFIPWRDAAKGLNYRRFFEITGLVGVRVEDTRVFEDMHRTALDLVRSGMVDGLRIDHIDGLADPAAYLKELRAAVGPDTYIVVEKILVGDEQLPEDWPVDGTTGYEVITSLGDLLVDHESEALDTAYRQIDPGMADAERVLHDTKSLMIDRNFRGEVAALEQLFTKIAAIENPDLQPDSLHAALRDVLLAFPVYRTYGTSDGLNDADSKLLVDMLDGIGTRTPALDLLHAALEGRVSGKGRQLATKLRIRIQHLTGPLHAKALEDTLFYRHHPLIALNEVGSDPHDGAGSVSRFHARMKIRTTRQPYGVTTTSTHDTKRGEDARARLYALSEAPDLWIEAVARWRIWHRHLTTSLSEGTAPDPNTEWMIYQALAGVWDDGDPHDVETRFLAFLEKALREAKFRTDWNDINEPYEQAVMGYAKGLLAPENTQFREDFIRTLKPYAEAGLHNSLTQTLLKLTLPGIPDIYQGCEGLDFSLVDPDNRRLPDFEHLADPTKITLDIDATGRFKQALISVVLPLRRKHPQLFTQGAYVPLTAEGPAARHIVAFARMGEKSAAIIVAPRLTFDLVRDGRIKSPETWRDTYVQLLPELRARAFSNVFGDMTENFGDLLHLEKLLADKPFALLMSEAG